MRSIAGRHPESVTLNIRFWSSLPAQAGQNDNTSSMLNSSKLVTACFLITFGFILLLANLGLVHSSLWLVLFELWPLLLVLWGIRLATKNELAYVIAVLAVFVVVWIFICSQTASSSRLQDYLLFISQFKNSLFL